MRTRGSRLTPSLAGIVSVLLFCAPALRAAAPQHEHGEHEHAEEGAPQHEHGEHGHAGEEGPREATVVGEVIDPVCYMRHDSRGDDHRKCAEYCAGQGITLAILDEASGDVLIALPVGHTNPNAPLLAHVAERVKPAFDTDRHFSVVPFFVSGCYSPS